MKVCAGVHANLPVLDYRLFEFNNYRNISSVQCNSELQLTDLLV